MVRIIGVHRNNRIIRGRGSLDNGSETGQQRPAQTLILLMRDDRDGRPTASGPGNLGRSIGRGVIDEHNFEGFLQFGQ